jgi:dTDP-4-amino-4,6-dideoxygalactose transaminase
MKLHTSTKKVPVFRPLIEKEEIAAAVESLELGWLGMGSYVKQFEEAVARVCRLKPEDDMHVVAVSTGHAALHLALMTMGIGPGDEVITPSFNNVADFQAIKAVGANPVFVDIDERTLCIDTRKIAPLINDKTKCIIAMDYDLSLCDHTALKAISEHYGVPVLHDAAHSFGSLYDGSPTGNQHPFTMFSFDPVKAVTCIDGGCLIVKGSGALNDLHAKRLIGMTQSAAQMYTNARAWTYDVTELGYRYHMANLHAAIGVAQISKLDQIRKTRQAVCERYYRELSTLEWLVAPGSNLMDVNPFLYYVRILDNRRDDFRDHLDQCGIDTGIHWQPGHNFEFFKKCRRGPLDVTEKIASEIVSLPLHSKMTKSDLDNVIEVVKAFR